jgi:hypothetical protein
MGRPPLDVVKTTVRLTRDVHRRITALVGENRMAVFLREAAEAELDRREAERREKARKMDQS